MTNFNLVSCDVFKSSMFTGLAVDVPQFPKGFSVYNFCGNQENNFKYKGGGNLY